ncbi:MAG: hypothetical protein R3D86_13300 [Emcibacteraceae bacterium]
MKGKWTKFDELIYFLRGNIGAILTLLFLSLLIASYFLDTPIHESYVEATLSGDRSHESKMGSRKIVFAKLENGREIELNMFPYDQVDAGARIKVDVRKGLIFGRRSYYFIEFTN